MARRIGVQAVLEAADFLNGLGEYMEGMRQAEGAVEGFGQAAEGPASRGLDMFEQVAIGALRRVGEMAINMASRAGQALAEMASQAIQGAMEAETVEARLGVVIGAMGDATTMTLQQADQLAEANRDLFQGNDELVRSVIQVGLSMGTVSTDQMPTFLRQVADLAAVTGEDAPNAARIFAQAYEDPISVLRRLRQQNILVDQDTQDTMRDLVEQGRTAEAAALLMDRVGQSTAGAAEAMADTTEGRLAIFREHLADMGEDVAGRFLGALDEPLQMLTPQIEEVFGGLADWLGRPEMVQGFQDLLTGALNLFEAFRRGPDENSPLMRFLNRMQAWWATYGPSITATGQALFARIRTAVADLAARMQPFMEDVLDRLATWWEENGPLIVEWAQMVGQRLGSIFEALIGAWDVVEPILGGLIDLILGLVTTAMQIATGDWAGAWLTIQNTASQVWLAIQGAIAAFADWVAGWFGTTWQGIVDQWRANWEAFKLIVQTLWEQIKTAIAEKVLEIVTNMGLFVDSVRAAIEAKVDQLVAAGQALITGLWDGINGRIQWLRNQVSRGIQGIVDMVRRLFGTHSPSEVFKDIGFDLMLGLAHGVQTGAPAAAASMRTAAGMVAAPAMAGATYNRNRSTVINMDFDAHYGAVQSPVTVRHDVLAVLAGVRR